MNNLIRKLLDISYQKQTVHIGSCLSALPILEKIFSENDMRKDVIILSKGHASLALYVVMWKHGFLSEDELNSYCENGSQLCGHVTRNKNEYLPITAGSLGIGVANAVGLAFGDQTRTVHVVCGDGETNEGIFWESLALINKFDLKNIHIYIDYNGFQGIGAVVDPFSVLIKKMEAFCKRMIFDVIPTKKGQGVSFMEDDNSWHYKKLTKEDYENACSLISSGSLRGCSC